MSDKQKSDYLKLIKHLDIQPAAILMIGNSLKSDVLPVLSVGGHAVNIPYHTTRAHEQVEHNVEHANFRHVHNMIEILPPYSYPVNNKNRIYKQGVMTSQHRR